jgi:YVTN family beta-propeller protein
MPRGFQRTKAMISWLCVLLVICDIGMGLWAGRNSRWFFNKPLSEYLGAIVDSLARWTGRIVWVVAIVIAAKRAFFSNSTSEPVSLDRIISVLVNGARRNLPLKFSTSIPATLFLLVIFGFLLINTRSDFAYVPPSSAILVTSDDKEIYAVDEANGKMAVFESMPVNGGSVKLKGTIDLNRSNVAAHPQRLAISPNGKMIYVADPASDEVTVIDRGNNEIVGHILIAPAGRTPRWIVFTPEGDKAYISAEGPVPQGSIVVVDTKKIMGVKIIKGLNCPEGLAILPQNHRLYVSSQCGSYGTDPVFSIDTVSDEVSRGEMIPQMAVGSGIAVSHRHQKLYVARGNFPSEDAAQTEHKAPFSIVDVHSRHTLQTVALQMSVNFVVVTPDEDYAIVSNGDQISFFDTETNKDVKDLYVGPDLRGLAVSRNGGVYLLFPGLRIQMFGLNGVVPVKSVPRQ